MKKKCRYQFLYYYQYLLILVGGMLFMSCQNNEPDMNEPERIENKPAFTLDLDLTGGMNDYMEGEEYTPSEFTSSDSQLRAAGINIKRDPDNRKFMLELDLKNGVDLPVVVACRRTSGNNKQIFVAKTSMELLKTGANANLKFRIKRGDIDFYPIEANGSRGDKNKFERESASVGDKYEIKLFVGASLDEVEQSGGVRKYLINYGINNTTNGSPIYMLSDDGRLTMSGVQGSIPFVSNWAKVLWGRNAQGKAGMSNNFDVDPITIKAQGSILMVKIKNKMSESKIYLENVRVYSESLTANIVYALDENKEFDAQPASMFKKNPTSAQLSFNSEYRPGGEGTLLNNNGGTKTFLFWAQGLSTEYLKGRDWIPTSITAQIKEQQGISGQNQKYWFTLPLLKTYDRLSRLHNGSITKTEIPLEDGTPIHPMNLMAHRFALNNTTNHTYTDRKYVTWREDSNVWASAFRNWEERYRLCIDPVVARDWRARTVTLPFSKVDNENPMYFVRGAEQVKYAFRTTTIPQLAAIFPIGATQGEIDKTWNTTVTIIREQALMEDYPKDESWYTIYQRKDKQTFAIRFLRKTKDNKYYMTPYTAAYRYAYVGPWNDSSSWWIEDGNNNMDSRLQIRMRPLGGITNQYNEADGQEGYFSPTFSEEKLKKLFDIVKLDHKPSYMPYDRWWIDHPLKKHDLVREYPALGYFGAQKWQYQIGSKLSIMTHDGTISKEGQKNIFVNARDDNFRFNWSSTHDYAPVILLADRKIIHK